MAQAGGSSTIYGVLSLRILTSDWIAEWNIGIRTQAHQLDTGQYWIID